MKRYRFIIILLILDHSVWKRGVAHYAINPEITIIFLFNLDQTV